MARTQPRIGPLAGSGSPAPALDVDALIDDPDTGISHRHVPVEDRLEDLTNNL